MTTVAQNYQHLIECLRQSEMGELAELIASTIGMPIVYCKCR